MAYLFLVGASLLLGALPSVGKFLLLREFTEGILIFYSGLIALVICLIIMLLKRQRFCASIKQILLGICAGLAGNGLTGLLLNSSYHYIPTSLALMFNFMYPAIVAVVMVVGFKEKLTKYKAAAIIVSIIGFVLIADFSGNVSIKGIILAFASSFTYSFYIIANDKSSISEVPVIEKLVYVYIGTVIPAVTSAADIRLVANDVLGLGVLVIYSCMVLGAFFMLLRGISKIGATKAAFLNMLEPIFNIIISKIVYDDPLGVKMLIGCSLVVAAILIIAIDNMKAEQV